MNRKGFVTVLAVIFVGITAWVIGVVTSRHALKAAGLEEKSEQTK